MNVEGEAGLAALALVRLDLTHTDEQPCHVEAHLVLQDLLARCGEESALSLVAVLVRLEANALTRVAAFQGRPVTELLDEVEMRELLRLEAEH